MQLTNKEKLSRLLKKSVPNAMFSFSEISRVHVLKQSEEHVFFYDRPKQKCNFHVQNMILSIFGINFELRLRELNQKDFEI